MIERIRASIRDHLAACWPCLGRATITFLAGVAYCAQAANFGIQWQGTGVPLTDSGGAFGVPTANWLTLSGPNGSQSYSPPSGGAIQVAWSTGGGSWQSGATFPGFSVGENQVLSGCLYAYHWDASGPISVTISGLNNISTGSYTLQAMAAVDGGSADYNFQSINLDTGELLDFSSPVTVGNAGGIASTTASIALSNDSITLTIAHDNWDSYLRAILSGLVITYTPAPLPVITTQPVSQTVTYHGNATLTAAATSGFPPLTYQWQFNDSDITGATNTSYSLTHVSDSDAGRYRLKVTDSHGMVGYSLEAALIVAPASAVMIFDPSTLSGASSSTYSPGIANYFSVVSATSVTVGKLGFVSPDSVISGTAVVQLWDVNAVRVLETVTFTSSDVGVSSGPGYLYLKASTNIITVGPGNYAVAQYGGSYISNPAGAAVNMANGAIVAGKSAYWSTFYGAGGPGYLPNIDDGTAPYYLGPTLQVSVSGIPVISHQPQGGVFSPGTNVTLTVTAGGSLPLAYQWKKNGSNIGSNSSMLTLANVGVADSGDYSVSVNNSIGSTDSAVATVTIAGTPSVDIQMNPGILVSGSVGAHYQVQYSSALNPTSWVLLQDIPALPSSPYLVVDPTPISTGKRFYRAILP